MSEYRLAKKPHIEEDVCGCAVLNHVDAETKPSDYTNDGVDKSVVCEPTEPIGGICHAHHAHTLFSFRFLFLYYLERNIVNWEHVDQEKEKGQE